MNDTPESADDSIVVADGALRLVRDPGSPATSDPLVHPTLRRAVVQEGAAADAIRVLANRVGSLPSLDSLDDSPVPDEPFDWAVVAEQDRRFVAEVLALVDDACARHLDVEYRTIARRFLARVLSRDPRVVRRSSSPARIAGGVLLAVLRANDGIGRDATQWRAFQVAEWFGVTSVGHNADALTTAVHVEPPYPPDPWLYRSPGVLGTVTLLHSRTKRSIVHQRRDSIVSFLADEKRRAGRRPRIVLSDGANQRRGCPAEVTRAARVEGPSRQPMVFVEIATLAPEPDVEAYALTLSEAAQLVIALTRALDDDQLGDGWQDDDVLFGPDDWFR